MKIPRFLAGCVLLTLAGTGCASAGGSADDGTPQVVVGFYPLQYLAERIGGSGVQVSSLAQPGAEPHDLELSPQQVQDVAEADLVLYLAAFQPAVDDAVTQNAEDSSLDLLTATDLAEGYEELDHQDERDAEEHEQSAPDPHVWLDPTRYAALAGAVADRMAQADPGNADTYTTNGEALVGELTALDEQFAAGLADCDRNEIVTTHNAFRYLADRYGLEQVGIVGLSPEEEPSAQRLAEIQEFAADNDVTTIFYEEAVSSDYAQTVADEVGAATEVLSPIEVADEGEDYFSLMQANLSTLQEALGCS